MALVVKKNKKNNQITKAMRNLALQKGMELVPYGPLVREVALPIGKAIYNRFRGNESSMVAHPGATAGAVAAPVAISRRITNRKPRFKAANGTISVSHRELITTVFNTTGALTVNNNIVLADGTSMYHVNPMNGRLFNWLPSIASNFDQYRVESLTFQYIPTCSTTETGRVVQYWDKDPSDPTPIDRAELGSYSHMSSSAPWAEDLCVVPCNNQWKLIADNSGSNSEPRLTDFGQYGFAVYGGTTTNQCGEVFVNYTISFKEPQPTTEVEVHIAGNGTSITSVNGPNTFATVSAPTATTIAVAFTGPGSFQATIQAACTGVAPSVAIFGISANSSYSVGSGTRVLSVSRVISPGFSSSTLTLSGLTAMTTWDVFVTRCDRRQVFQ